MANTLAEVYNRVYQLMAEKATSTTYPVAFVVAKINEKITAICK